MISKYYRNSLPELLLDVAAVRAKEWESPLLDIGCGKGDLLYRLKEECSLRPVGLDFSQKQLDCADPSRVPFVRGDAFSLPFKDESVSSITCFNTLYNYKTLDDLSGMFSEMARVLKPEGRIVVDVRNKWNPVLAIKYRIHMMRGHFPTVTHDPQELAERLLPLGCRLKRKTAFGIPNALLAWGYLLEFVKTGK